MTNTDDPPVSGWTTPVFGRDDELRLLRAFLQRAAVRGGVLMLHGEPGVGKTTLLDAAEQFAVAAGTRVLRAAGSEFERGVSFAGLHQALVSLSGELERLPAAPRVALSMALGIGGDAGRSRADLSEAVLALLREVASDSPLLLIIDDVPWLDRVSALVLGATVRGLSGSRIGVLTAARSGEGILFDTDGLPQHEVRPLDAPASAELLRDRYPHLADAVVSRLQREAAGNPLALLELPAALTSRELLAAAALPTHLPLSKRVQTLYADRIEALSPPARQLLLQLALHNGADAQELTRAAGSSAAALLPAIEGAQLLSADRRTGRAVFRHPLVRATVVERSTSSERQRAHRSLATLLAGDEDRSTWHLSEATLEPDEDIAGRLEQAAHRILQRGDALGAVSALLRAADLSPTRRDRARRLASAAYVGADVAGDLDVGTQLLMAAHQVDPSAGDSLQAAVAASYLLLNGDGDIDTAHRLLVGAIETHGEHLAPDDPLLAEAVHNLFEVCLYGSRPELWRSFHAAVARLSLEPSPVLALWVATMADPVRTAGAAVETIEKAIADLQDETDLTRIERVATAAIYVDRVDDTRSALERAVTDGRSGGAVTSAINALMLLTVDDFKTGRWVEGQRQAEEGIALCDQHGYRLLTWPLQLARGLVAAGRGDEEVSLAIADAMTRWAAPRGVLGVHNFAWHIRSLAALSRGDFEEAYQCAAAISPAGRFASHVGHALWVCMDLVESAVRAGRPREAAAHVQAMDDAGIATLSSRLALLVAGSRAMATPGPPTELFDFALARPGAYRWPFDLARVRLFYGERLLRDGTAAPARLQLVEAHRAFLRLGALPWVKRAERELAAVSGLEVRSGPKSAATLTPQEYAVAELAAAGRTNKQIGAQLLISHRTVGTHLHQAFHKLGISTRAALRDALDVSRGMP